MNKVVCWDSWLIVIVAERATTGNRICLLGSVNYFSCVMLNTFIGYSFPWPSFGYNCDHGCVKSDVMKMRRLTCSKEIIVSWVLTDLTPFVSFNSCWPCTKMCMAKCPLNNIINKHTIYPNIFYVNLNKF